MANIRNNAEFYATSSIQDRIRTVYEKSLYTDVEFLVDKAGSFRNEGSPHSSGPQKSGSTQFLNRGNSLLAHRAILAAGSPYFASLFFGPKPHSGKVVYVKDITYSALQNVLSFLYTDCVYFTSVQEAVETMTAAEKYNLHQLKTECDNFVNEVEIDTNEVCSLLDYATTGKMEGLKTQCLQLVSEQTAQVLRSPNFECMTVRALKEVLKLNRLSVQYEVQLLDAVMRWAAYQDRTGNSTRNIVQPLLSHFRFLSMSPGEFSDCISRHKDLLTNDESLAIMMHLSNPAVKANIPSWCNKGPKRCGQKESIGKVNTDQDQRKKTKIMAIPLKPSPKTLEFQCLSFLIEFSYFNQEILFCGLKLKFCKNPASPQCTLNCVISTTTKQSMSRLAKGRFSNKEEFNIKFSKPIQLSAVNQTVKLEVECTDICGYTFYSYDYEKGEMNQDVPFDVVLSCVPDDYSFFVINEIFYEADASPRPENKPGKQRRKFKQNKR